MAEMWTIEWKERVDEVAGELWGRCFAEPLEGRWWYAALEKSGVEDQFLFAYGVLKRAGVDVGIVPTFVMDVPMDLVAPPGVAKALRVVGKVVRRARYQRTLFVGSPCSDEGTVGLVEGVTLAEVAEVLQGFLEKRQRAVGAAILVWKDFAEGDWPALEKLSAERGLFRVVSYPGTRVRLGGGFEGYLKRLKGSHRHNLRKKLKRGAEKGRLVTEVKQRPTAAEREEMWGLFWQTYEKGKTKFERLTPKFFEVIAQEEAAWFLTMRHAESGKLAAFMLCFDCGKRVINKFIGLDYGLGEGWYLYFQLWAEAAKWASERGAEELQSGQTGYRAKLDMGHALMPMNNYCRHRNGVFNWIFGRVTRGVDWAELDGDLTEYVTAQKRKLEERGKEESGI